MALKPGVIVAIIVIGYVALTLLLFWLSQRRHQVLYEGGYPKMRVRWPGYGPKKVNLPRKPEMVYGLGGRRSIGSVEALGAIHPAFVPDVYKEKGGDVFFGPGDYYMKSKF